MVNLSLWVDLISLKIACDFVMNSVYYSKNTSSGPCEWWELVVSIISLPSSQQKPENSQFPQTPDWYLPTCDDQ